MNKYVIMGSIIAGAIITLIVGLLLGSTWAMYECYTAVFVPH